MRRTDLDGISEEEHRAKLKRLRAMTISERAQETIKLMEEAWKMKRLAFHFEHYPFQWTDD